MTIEMTRTECLQTVAQLTQANRELVTTIQTLRNALDELTCSPPEHAVEDEPETINPYGRGMVQVDPGRP